VPRALARIGSERSSRASLVSRAAPACPLVPAFSGRRSGPLLARGAIVAGWAV